MTSIDISDALDRLAADNGAGAVVGFQYVAVLHTGTVIRGAGWADHVQGMILHSMVGQQAAEICDRLRDSGDDDSCDEAGDAETAGDTDTPAGEAGSAEAVPQPIRRPSWLQVVPGGAADSALPPPVAVVPATSEPAEPADIVITAAEFHADPAAALRRAAEATVLVEGDDGDRRFALVRQRDDLPDDCDGQA